MRSSGSPRASGDLPADTPRSGRSSAAGSSLSSPQPASQLSRTVRTALSGFGSSRQIDCHVPSAEPPGDDRHGQRRRGQERQDMIGAVARRSMRCRYSRSSRGSSRSSAASRSSSDPAADLDHDEAGRGVRDEDRQQPVAAAGASAASATNRAHSPVRSKSPRPDPVRTAISRPTTGRCSAARPAGVPGRPSPAPTRSGSARPRRGSRRPTRATPRPCCRPD